MATQEEKIEEGRKAFRKIRTAVETAWEDWEPVIQALKIGSDYAARKAEIPQGEKRAGKKYSNLFSQWLSEHKWGASQGGPGKTTRAACLKCADDLVAIRKFRASQFEEDPDKALLLNHPQKVWSSFNSKVKGEKPPATKKPVNLEKLADIIADLDTDQVLEVLELGCVEKALLDVTNKLEQKLSTKTIQVGRRGDPAKVATQLAFELEWQPQQVERVIEALQKYRDSRVAAAAKPKAGTDVAVTTKTNGAE